MTNSKVFLSDDEYRKCRINTVDVSYALLERAQKARERTAFAKIILFSIFSVLVIAQIICEIFFSTCIVFHITSLIVSVIMALIGGCIDGASMDSVNNDYYAMGKAFYQYAISLFLFAMMLIYVF